jgi:hypothetical protein
MALSMVSHPGGTYRFRQVPQCRICASPLRGKVERLWSEGVPPSLILRRLPPDHGLSRQSLSRHLNRGHTPVDRRLVAKRAEVRAERRWAEIGLACTVFAAEEAELASWAERALVGMVSRGELELSERGLVRIMELLHRWVGEERGAHRARAAAEVLAERYRSALLRVFDAVREVGGDDVTHGVVAFTRRNLPEEDILRLPGLESLLRWHVNLVNSPDVESA